jgi:hypothetical protein
MSSILCYESSGPDSWRDHFCFVNPDSVVQYDEAAATIAQEHLATAYSLQAESGDVENVVPSLREAGYIRLSDFQRARGS